MLTAVWSYAYFNLQKKCTFSQHISPITNLYYKVKLDKSLHFTRKTKIIKQMGKKMPLKSQKLKPGSRRSSARI